MAPLKPLNSELEAKNTGKRRVIDWISLQRHEWTQNFGLPGGASGRRNLRSIGTDYLVEFATSIEVHVRTRNPI